MYILKVNLFQEGWYEQSFVHGNGCNAAARLQSVHSMGEVRA